MKYLECFFEVRIPKLSGEQLENIKFVTLDEWLADVLDLPDVEVLESYLLMRHMFWVKTKIYTDNAKGIINKVVPALVQYKGHTPGFDPKDPTNYEIRIFEILHKELKNG